MMRKILALLLCICMLGSLSVYALGDNEASACTCGTETETHAAECALYEAPEEPETPEEPVAPKKPDAPKPEDPPKPEAPEKPVAPEKPEGPEKPVAPEKPEGPEKPDAPVAPEISEISLEDTAAGVAVTGKIPEDVSLTVESATLAEIRAIEPELGQLPEDYKAFDITMQQESGEWQPEDEPVSVSMNVSDLGEDGDGMLVYHVHDNGDGTTTTELLGPFTVQDGQIDFQMDSFSYVLVFCGDTEYPIENVSAFYPVSEGTGSSNNNKYQVLGIYYDEAGNLHFLLASTELDGSKFKYLFIDEKTFEIAQMSSDDVKTVRRPFKTVEFRDGETLLHTSTVNSNRAAGFYDVNIGQIDVSETIRVAISNNRTRPSSSGAWDVVTTIGVDLDYEIIKTVAPGTDATGVTFSDSITVDRGDWVIYRINVNNKDSCPLSGVLVQDILPEGVFDMDTVEMSIDGANGAIGSWQPFNETMFDNYSSKGNFSRLLYIKAQVNPDLQITKDTSYVNTVTMDGKLMPQHSDTATITVKAPTIVQHFTDLTITKTGTADIDENQSYIFDVAGPDGFKLAVTITGYGSTTIKNLPFGTYTVTERTSWSWRYTPTAISQEISLVADPKANVVAFANGRTFDKWLSGDSIAKNSWAAGESIR